MTVHTDPLANSVFSRMYSGRLVPRTMGAFHNIATHAPKAGLTRTKAEMHACAGCRTPHPQCACCGRPSTYATHHATERTTGKGAGRAERTEHHFMTFCDDCWATVEAVRLPDTDRTEDVEL